MKDKKTKKEPKIKNWVLRNLFWGIVFVAGLLLVINITLGIVTQHGISVKVPDMQSSTVEQAQALASKRHLTVRVVDSVFVHGFRKGVVFSQNPAAGSQVKHGREIELVVNASQEKLVPMPNLIGLSMRQAQAEILSRGLRLGKLEYVSDMATNNVLGQKVDGRDIEAGTRIPAYENVDLILGLNASDCTTFIPNVVGSRYQRAVATVHDHSLNVGNLNFDNTVSSYADSLAAVVYRQNPEPSDREVRMGSGVKLFLTLDESKVPEVQPAATPTED